MASAGGPSTTTAVHHSHPPVPFADFQFSFDPSIHPLFPEPPPVPPSADLFSQSETTNLFGFLDNFNWEFDSNGYLHSQPSRHHRQQDQQQLHHQHHHQQQQQQYHYDFQQTGPPPPPEPSVYGTHMTRPSSSSSMGGYAHRINGSPPRKSASPTSSTASSQLTPIIPSSLSFPHTTHSSSGTTTPNPTSTANGNGNGAKSKSLLSNPQKRMNHIMSEQKRRNAIREGYAQLTTLLAPAGAPPGTGMPTRGRPKGSGGRGKGRPGKGKSGVLLRAVEYIHWLEEGREALREEVRRMEAAAGLRVDL